MEIMEVDNAVEFFKSWSDTGLIDENGDPRLSLGYWDRWLPLPYYS